MSGFLGNILGSLMGGGGGSPAGAGNLLSTVMSEAGGPAGILQKFQQAGLGEKAESWIGGNHNLPISADQIEQVFPPAQLDAWAQQHGLPAGVASQVLAHFLPHAVDATTPDGAVPPQGSPAAAPSGMDFGGMISRLTGQK
jgi:uncharacterized protein YidB (DUF937 family)